MPEKKLLINVSYDISNPQTLSRELNGLQEAVTELKLTEAYLINNYVKDTVVNKKQTIHIVPLWEWLLD